VCRDKLALFEMKHKAYVVGIMQPALPIVSDFPCFTAGKVMCEHVMFLRRVS
jgi:hypothetical protein